MIPDITIRELADVAWQTPSSDAAATADGSAALKNRFALKAWSSIKYDATDDHWLLDGLLPSEGLAVVFGKPKQFKSFVALDLAVAVACGNDWAGRKVRQGAVVYIVGEGQLGMRKRIEAYKRARSGCDTDLPVSVIDGRPNLGALPGDRDELIQSIRNELNGRDLALVVVDTLSRTLAGADENNDGMRNFIDNGEGIAAVLGCLVLAVHHEGHEGGRKRGHSSLGGAVVASWHVEKTTQDGGYGCKVRVEDAKDAEDGIVFGIALKEVDLGSNRHGRRETTLIIHSVAIEGGAGGEPQKPKGIPPSLKAFLRAFELGLERHGRGERPYGPSGPELRVLGKEDLRAEYYARRPDDSPDAKRKAFDRNVHQAVARELLFSATLASGKIVLWKA